MANPAEAVDISNYGPIHSECEVHDLKVNGALPRELNGSLLRNGPNPQFDVPKAHWFAGDGMLHSFTLEDGKASYRNRWVRTPKFLAEHDAGRAIFSGFGSQTLPGAPATDVTDTGVANTNIVWHGGRLLALEEAHLPTEIDRHTLATLGYRDYDGGLPGAFTAHPKIDPVTGEMIFFGYNANGPFTSGMTCGAIDAGGVVTRLERFDAPYSSMVHDFIVTSRHILFPILPLTGSMERARSGRPAFAWEPEKGAYVGVMKRGGKASDMVWFRGEACYVFHVMNAWEDGDLIIADVMQTEEAPLFPHADGSAPDPLKSRARLCRWTFDMSGRTDTFSRTYLDDLAGEFPRIDDRRAGLANRHGWIACARPGAARGGLFDGIAHFDAEAGRRREHFLPLGDATSEPVFVPRSADAPEGDGWLLSVVWRAAENRSDLAVFNATEVEAGPIATVELGHRVPFGFHGNWVPAG
ncbi:MAG: carotenoid oxygenase family protein [Rhizobiales bacterium]|nr:carotenoid oxygenase family protein [Hyphomicrobiales bacterium]